MKKVLRILGWFAVIPVSLFIIVVTLLYIPAIQNFLVDKVTTYVSEETGMSFKVDNIRLGFPLNLRVNGVEVLSMEKDTLLSAKTLQLDIQLLPLLKKQIEVDGIGLKDVKLDTKDFIPSVALKGSLGEFYLASHGVALDSQTAIVNKAVLRNTNLFVCLTDTTVADTTASSPTLWRILLKKMQCEKVKVALALSDTTHMSVALEDLLLEDGDVDLYRSIYGIHHLSLKNGAFTMDTDTLAPQPGLDVAHLALFNWNMEVDSVVYGEREMKAMIRKLSLEERSGLDVLSLTGKIHSDDHSLYIPSLRLETSDSFLETKAVMDWNVLKSDDNASVSMRFLAELGKQDLMLFAGGMPEDFVREYPNQPLILRAGLDGNIRSLRITGLDSKLKGVYELRVDGGITNVLDSVKRKGEVDLELNTYNLDFVRTLTGLSPSVLTIPQDMKLNGKMRVEGEHYMADIKLDEGIGTISVAADCSLDREEFHAVLAIDSIYGKDFLPQDSLKYISAEFSVDGRGFDVFHPSTQMQAGLSVSTLQYAGYDLSDLQMQTTLSEGKAEARLLSNNDLLAMNTTLSMVLNQKELDGRLIANINKADLKKISALDFPFEIKGLFALNLKTDYTRNHWLKGSVESLSFMSEKNVFNPKNIYFTADLKADTTIISASAGDLNLYVDGQRDITSILNSFLAFGNELSGQLENRCLDQNKLKTLLPKVCMRIKSGKDNPFYNFMVYQGFKYNDLFADFDVSPIDGVTGHSYIYSLRTDSLQLDTIRFDLKQDSLGVKMLTEVRNAPTNKQFVFDAKLNSCIHSKGASMELDYYNEQGQQGVRLGMGVDMTDYGWRFKLFPEQPILAFKTFTLNKNNFVDIYKNGHIEADVTLENEDGVGLRLYSSSNETVLCDLTLSLAKIDIGEITQALPYLPDVKGVWNAEMHYLQTFDDKLSVAVETSVKSMSYAGMPIGDVACSGIYLPKDNDTHFMDVRVLLDEQEVAVMNGDYQNVNDGVLDMALTMNHFPLKLVNGFIPERMVVLSGDLDGNVKVTGSASNPKINGQLMLDSVSAASEMYGVNFRFDNRPVRINDSKLNFDNFSVFTQGDNPFILTGSVDFSAISDIILDLRMVARNYELVNAPRKKNSVLYGKVYVDLFSTLKGKLDNLKMRGNVNVQGRTDVTYVLKDSPLTVEDRLSGLVTFVNFKDTVAADTSYLPVYRTGGMDILMTVKIDEGAQARVDLSEDRESYISLNGGGTLSMQYTPQGEFLLSGRYTVIDGQMKYALPVIPLKTFSLKSGSFVEFNGNPMNPSMNIVATERVRTSVTENDVPRVVAFDVGVAITNTLENMGLEFTLQAPEDSGLQNQLAAMSKEERGKLAVAMLATGMYLGEGGDGKSSGGFDANSALNSFLQSEISSIAGSALKTVDITLGMEDATSSDGSQHKDYSFRFAKRFWNNRISIVIGGRISTGNDDPNAGNSESFIDDISLEWRLDDSGTRYIRVFHNTNFDSMLDGEIVETGAGIVLRKKVSKLGELFIFRKRQPNKMKKGEQITTEK